jgi:hypothetical protein
MRMHKLKSAIKNLVEVESEDIGLWGEINLTN